LLVTGLCFTCGLLLNNTNTPVDRFYRKRCGSSLAAVELSLRSESQWPRFPWVFERHLASRVNDIFQRDFLMTVQWLIVSQREGTCVASCFKNSQQVSADKIVVKSYLCCWNSLGGNLNSATKERWTILLNIVAQCEKFHFARHLSQSKACVACVSTFIKLLCFTAKK